MPRSHLFTRAAPLLQALLMASVASGCVSQQVKKVGSTQAQYAQAEVPSEALLQMAILTFDPGIPDTIKEQEEANVIPEVREAEAKYLPHVLRDTVQNTGFWGAVRVVPAPVNTADVTVRGTILGSDGELLKLAVTAEDATGRVWLEKTYEETAAEYAYTEKLPAGTDPFQDIYNRIANDLLAERSKMSTAELVAVRRAADMRFAAQLAPDRFSEYVETDRRGRVTVNRLPPSNDPVLARVEKIREREELLVDTLDAHYGNYRQNIGRPYQEWREATYREAMILRELKGAEWTRKILGAAAVLGGIAAVATADNQAQSTIGQAAVIGGIFAVQSGIGKGQERKLHEESLRELNASLASEVEPQTVELDGKTIMLTGSAEEQYRQWQALLAQMVAAERGEL
ncbi:hypothetical protein [Polycyclovorans algicola]|uniref:hypothetical protein n=1 Tax=Polycyclovorans algicola TaxID=616992 RepID=UPI0004A73FAE|nr:hypothetical protein [Polycyclovorans algicola]